MLLLNTVLGCLKDNGRNLFRLLAASWLMTNTMCLLMNSSAIFTLDFVRQISLRNYFGLWAGIYACLALLLVLSGRAGRLRFPLAPSVAMYAAALMIKEALAL